MISLKLYKNSAEPNRVNKIDYLEYVTDILGTMRDGGSVSHMVIRIATPSIPDFNYIHIPELNRYYYVSDVEFIRTNLWDITLAVDVLMSYKEGILNLTAFVDRNEFNKNPYILDKKRVIVNGCDYIVDAVKNSLFISEGYGSYILTGLMIDGR